MCGMWWIRPGWRGNTCTFSILIYRAHETTLPGLYIRLISMWHSHKTLSPPLSSAPKSSEHVLTCLAWNFDSRDDGNTTTPGYNGVRNVFWQHLITLATICWVWDPVLCIFFCFLTQCCYFWCHYHWTSAGATNQLKTMQTNTVCLGDDDYIFKSTFWGFLFDP